LILLHLSGRHAAKKRAKMAAVPHKSDGAGVGDNTKRISLATLRHICFNPKTSSKANASIDLLPVDVPLTSAYLPLSYTFQPALGAVQLLWGDGPTRNHPQKPSQ